MTTDHNPTNTFEQRSGLDPRGGTDRRHYLVHCPANSCDYEQVTHTPPPPRSGSVCPACEEAGRGSYYLSATSIDRRQEARPVRASRDRRWRQRRRPRGEDRRSHNDKDRRRGR